MKTKATRRLSLWDVAVLVIFAGLAAYVGWLAMSDWMFWHYMGPSPLLFLALLLVGLGAMMGLLWLLGAVLTPKRPWTPGPGAGRIAVLALLLLPGVLVFRHGLSLLPRIRREYRQSELSAMIGKGPEVLPAALEAFGSDLPMERSYACLILGAMGPKAKPAVPVLQDYLEKHRDRPGDLSAVVRALGEIGPDSKASIPTMVQLASAESSPGYLRGAVVEALPDMGPEGQAARRELVPVLLPLLIDQLERDDPKEVEQAALALASLKRDALPALPALQARLREITSAAPYRSNPSWQSTSNMLETCIRLIDTVH